MKLLTLHQLQSEQLFSHHPLTPDVGKNLTEVGIKMGSRTARRNEPWPSIPTCR